MMRRLEIIVVGGGIAGMSYATQLVDHMDQRPVRIRILSKAPVQGSNSYAAQGGVAVVVHKHDTFAEHVQDTLTVGAGRNDPAVVERVVREGPELVRGLMALGAAFDADATGRLHLAREGGHSTARVVHHQDRTGAEIVRVLQDRVYATPAIEVHEGWRAIDLLVEGVNGKRHCTGVRALERATGLLHDLHADLVVLATGGVGQVYRHTTNPAEATGDGIGMASRAGVPLRDMAFVQFHPTALYTADPGQAFLISEAVRGAGARLLRYDGDPLMDGEHPMGDLAPRNVVARAIHREMMRSDRPHVWLDPSPIGIARFAREFPAIDRRCCELGIKPGRDPIPVMPAAHYLCGGIATDDRGRTALSGLLALGECAGSGLHGADRLASNSLLEALVIPKRAAEATAGMAAGDAALASDRIFSRIQARTHARVERGMQDLRHAMSNHLGILRDRDGMGHALRSIAHVERSMARSWSRKRWSEGLFALRDMVAVARAIAESALEERESVGTHYLMDDGPSGGHHVAHAPTPRAYPAVGLHRPHQPYPGSLLP